MQGRAAEPQRVNGTSAVIELLSQAVRRCCEWGGPGTLGMSRCGSGEVMSWTRVCSRLKGQIAQMTSWILIFAQSEAMQIVLAQSAREVSASTPGNLVRDTHIIQNLQNEFSADLSVKSFLLHCSLIKTAHRKDCRLWNIQHNPELYVWSDISNLKV